MSISGFGVICRVCETTMAIGFDGDPRTVRCNCGAVLVEIDGPVARVMEQRIGASVIIPQKTEVRVHEQAKLGSTQA